MMDYEALIERLERYNRDIFTESATAIKHLIAENADADAAMRFQTGRFIDAQREADALRAELAAIKGQEPALYVNGGELDNAFDGRSGVTGVTSKTGWHATPLYRAPIPSTTQDADAGELAQIEVAAKAIYQRFPGAALYPWVDGGNSDKQTYARQYARGAIAALAQKGSTE